MILFGFIKNAAFAEEPKSTLLADNFREMSRTIDPTYFKWAAGRNRSRRHRRNVHSASIGPKRAGFAKRATLNTELANRALERNRVYAADARGGCWL